ncbi:MAG: hypothetical protein IT289_07160 [Oligoflexia bacterium]|nr:hypothetical protein [Oligoflexia bacterium]
MKTGLPLLFFSLLTMGQCIAFAATSPNSFSDPKRKLDLRTEATKWEFFSGDDIAASENRETELLVVARAPQVVDGAQSTLSWRIDRQDSSSAQAYAEKWIKEFPKFGYEVKQSKAATYGSLSGYDLELTSTVSDRRLRQFLVAKNKEMWIFTCSATRSQFQKAWEACQQILSSSRLSEKP